VAPGVGASVTTTLSGTYTLTLAAGTYQVTALAEGFASQTFTSIAITSGSVTIQDFALAPLLPFYLPLVVRGLSGDTTASYR
jgi:hypothetical protein